MAVDATGTPSPLGIPKYNTGADAPSGKGLNAIVDALDTLLTARITKPSAPAAKDALVWNGSTWEKSSAANPINEAHIDPGANLEMLRTVGATPTWTKFPGARVYASAAQAIPNGVVTAVTFDQEVFDDDGMHDNAVNNNRITIATAGRYLVTATVQFASSAAGAREVQIRVNGTYIALDDRMPSTAGVTGVMVATHTNSLIVGDYIDLAVYQNSGGALNLNAPYSALTVQRVA